MTAKQSCHVALSVLARHQHRELSHRVVALCYHSIDPTKSFRSATPELFEQHLIWLKDHCEIIRFGQVFDALKAEKRNRPAVAITIDDGIFDNYEWAFPLLEKYAIPATFFLTVGLVERDVETIERFRELYRSCYKDIRPLNWSQVRELQRAGMEIGSHTFSHPNLARLDERSVKAELRNSKETIEQRLGKQITLLAYPFGIPRIHFSAETVKVVADVGYKLAAAVLFRPVLSDRSRFVIPRYLVMNDEIETIRDKVLGVWDFHGLWQEKAPIWAARFISPSFFVGESCTKSPLSAGSANGPVTKLKCPPDSPRLNVADRHRRLNRVRTRVNARAGLCDTYNLKLKTRAAKQNNGYSAEVDSVSKAEWDDILQMFDDYSLMQTSTYGSIRWGEKNLSHVVLKKGGKIIAATQVIIVTVPFLPIGLAYVNWGPSWQPSGQPKNLDNFRHMIQALYRTYVVERGLLLRIFPNSVESDSGEVRTILEEEGFQKDLFNPPKRTVLIDLSHSLEELRQSLEKRWRHNLVLAERNTLSITSGADIESFRQLMALYEEMKARKAWDSIPDVKYFERIQHDIAPPLKMMCMICWHGGVPISGVAVSKAGNTAVLFLAATGNRGLTLRSSYFLQWQVLKWLKRLNARWYDLFGINRETHPGTYQFKSGLGGKLGSEINYVGAYHTGNRPITQLSVQVFELGSGIVNGLKRSLVTLLRRRAGTS